MDERERKFAKVLVSKRILNPGAQESISKLTAEVVNAIDEVFGRVRVSSMDRGIVLGLAAAYIEHRIAEHATDEVMPPTYERAKEMGMAMLDAALSIGREVPGGLFEFNERVLPHEDKGACERCGTPQPGFMPGVLDSRRECRGCKAKVCDACSVEHDVAEQVPRGPAS